MAKVNIKLPKTYALYKPQIDWVRQEAERLSQSKGIPVSDSEIICTLIEKRMKRQIRMEAQYQSTSVRMK